MRVAGARVSEGPPSRAEARALRPTGGSRSGCLAPVAALNASSRLLSASSWLLSDSSRCLAPVALVVLCVFVVVSVIIVVGIALVSLLTSPSLVSRFIGVNFLTCKHKMLSIFLLCRFSCLPGQLKFQMLPPAW